MKKPGVTTIANSHMKHLWRGAEKQSSVVEVYIFGENNNVLLSSSLP